MTAPLPSYTSATATVPLLGDTIGDNFGRTVAAHGDRLALVDVAAGKRYSYGELAVEVDALALALLDGECRSVTGSASGRPTAPSG